MVKQNLCRQPDRRIQERREKKYRQAQSKRRLKCV